MTALAALLALIAFGYFLRRYAPYRNDEAFRLDRYRPPSPLTDWSSSYYDEQRRYTDLVAVYGRRDMPDPGPPVANSTEEAAPASAYSAPSEATSPNSKTPGSGKTGPARANPPIAEQTEPHQAEPCRSEPRTPRRAVPATEITTPPGELDRSPRRRPGPAITSTPATAC
ncbi:hypothetical protein [Nocardia sp. NPDC052566]|uniref:hypothetical protein n=1 Tax=Nocardia sp. NPDC052566 TaxID=3364330 RepID=UPI0037C8B40B